MLTLYHHGSSACAAKVRFALEEKRLAWDSRYVDIMRGEQFAPEYLALNPKAVVPTLVDDGEVIPESTVICEYLEDAYPGTPLYPGGALERARVRLWTKAVDEELHPACSALTYIVSHRHTLLSQGIGGFEEFLASGQGEGRAARERKWLWIQRGLEAPGAAGQLQVYMSYIDKLERALEGRQWLAGDSFTMADVAMAPYVNRLAALAMERVWSNGRRPRVAEWFARVRQRPAFAPAFVRWMPEELAARMRANGRKSWSSIAELLGIEPS